MESEAVLATPTGHWPTMQASASKTQSYNATPFRREPESDVDLPDTPFRKLIQQRLTGAGLKSGARRVVVTVPKEEEKQAPHISSAPPTSPARATKGNYMKPTEAFRLGLEDASSTPQRVLKKNAYVVSHTPTRQTPLSARRTKPTPETVVRGHQPTPSHDAAISRHLHANADVWQTPARAPRDQQSQSPRPDERLVFTRRMTEPTSPPRTSHQPSGTILFSPLTHSAARSQSTGRAAATPSAARLAEERATPAFTKRASTAPRSRPQPLASALQGQEQTPSRAHPTPLRHHTPAAESPAPRLTKPLATPTPMPPPSAATPVVAAATTATTAATAAAPFPTTAVALQPAANASKAPQKGPRGKTRLPVTADKLSANKAAKKAAMAKAIHSTTVSKKSYLAPTFSHLMSHRSASVPSVETKAKQPRSKASPPRRRLGVTGEDRESRPLREDADDILQCISVCHESPQRPPLHLQQSHPQELDDETLQAFYADPEPPKKMLGIHGSVFTASVSSLPDNPLPSGAVDIAEGVAAPMQRMAVQSTQLVEGKDESFHSEISSVHGLGEDPQAVSFQASLDLSAIHDILEEECKPRAITPSIKPPALCSTRGPSHDVLDMDFSDLSIVEAPATASPKSLSFSSSFIGFPDTTGSSSATTSHRRAFSPVHPLEGNTSGLSTRSRAGSTSSAYSMNHSMRRSISTGNAETLLATMSHPVSLHASSGPSPIFPAGSLARKQDSGSISRNDWCREIIDMLPNVDGQDESGLTMMSSTYHDSDILNVAMLQSTESEALRGVSVQTAPLLTDSMMSGGTFSEKMSHLSLPSLSMDSPSNNRTLATPDVHFIVRTFQQADEEMSTIVQDLPLPSASSTAMMEETEKGQEEDEEEVQREDSPIPMSVPLPTPTPPPVMVAVLTTSSSFLGAGLSSIIPASEDVSTPAGTETSQGLSSYRFGEEDATEDLPSMSCPLPESTSHSYPDEEEEEQEEVRGEAHDAEEDEAEEEENDMTPSDQVIEEMRQVMEPDSGDSVLSSMSLLPPTQSAEVDALLPQVSIHHTPGLAKHVVRHHNFEELERATEPLPPSPPSSPARPLPPVVMEAASERSDKEDDPLHFIRMRLLQRTNMSFQEIGLQVPSLNTRRTSLKDQAEESDS